MYLGVLKCEPEPAGGSLAGWLAIAATLVLVSAAVVGSVGAAAGSVAESDDTPTALEHQPSNATLSLSVADSSTDRLTVTLATDAADVAGYGVNVSFDPDVLAVESVSGVDMNDPVVNKNTRAGWVFLTQSTARGTDGPTLAQLTFSVRERGETTLSIDGEESTLNNGEVPPGPIRFDASGTTVTAGGEGPPGGGSGDGAPGDGTDGAESGQTDSSGDGPGEKMSFVIIPVLILVPSLLAVGVLLVAASVRRRL